MYTGAVVRVDECVCESTTYAVAFVEIAELFTKICWNVFLCNQTQNFQLPALLNE